jgi:hypothetical protein
MGSRQSKGVDVFGLNLESLVDQLDPELFDEIL